ncbi:unnamed protein product [Adineta steineri]|uniref:Uncharacterized protein n=1 Tax=Adineta steineri TaxID=433720 RepID=A0A813UFN5_9BILA|nr:unnamed protein product [Adineta steineri]
MRSFQKNPSKSTTNDLTNVRKSTRSKKISQHESTSSFISTQSTNGTKTKGKRKLRAIDAEDDDLYTLGNLSQTINGNNDIDCEQISRYIGQNGILSQTRKTNETTITTTTFEDDFSMKLQSKKDEILSTEFNQNSNDDATMTTATSDTSIDNSMNILGGNVTTLDEVEVLREVMENNDNESLFTSINKTYETNTILNNNSIINYDNCIEDISNDGIDPPPSSSSPSLPHCSVIT